MAVSEAEDPDSIDIADFTYPGPAPRSKEIALVMLADGYRSPSAFPFSTH